MAAATARHYDFIVCGSGPGGAACVRGLLRGAPTARIAMLERGPWSKTDLLSEHNPVKAWLGSRAVVADYAHDVVQGAAMGGGSAVNNYAWVTPSAEDVQRSFGLSREQCGEATLAEYEAMCDGLLAERAAPHLLHKLLTMDLPRGTELVDNAAVRVRSTNRGKVFLGSPTLTAGGARRSALTGVIEPLWRENFARLDIVPDTAVDRVLFDEGGAGEAGCRAVGVQTSDGERWSAEHVVLAAGCLETPALLLRSGVGPEEQLAQHGIPVVLVNEHVGQHLRDKMLLDDMLMTDSTLGDFDKSLLIVNRVFDDGASVQLHRYDKSTVGNSYLALKRLVLGSWQDGGLSALASGIGRAAEFASPKGYAAFCFQTYFKMKSEASVTLGPPGAAGGPKATLDASALFAEAAQHEAEFRARTSEIYEKIFEMRAKGRIAYEPCVRGIRSSPAKHMRLVWHFAGSARVGDVVDADDFSVLGVKGLHIADMSAARVCPDGGAMAMAYLAGHLCAARMLGEKN